MPLGSTVFVGRVVDGGPAPLFSSALPTTHSDDCLVFYASRDNIA